MSAARGQTRQDAFGSGRSRSPARGKAGGRRSPPRGQNMPDSSGSGAASSSAQGTQDAVLELCCKFDVNGDGSICVDDLTKVLDAAGCARANGMASAAVSSAVTSAADTRADSGKVSVQAFSTWFRGAGAEQAQLHDYIVQTIFAYGTLRGDFSKDGDRWGVIKEFGGQWRAGAATGFKLYQNTGLFYPFAVQTGDDSDTLRGTVLQFPDGAMATNAVQRCNGIEGFAATKPLGGLYRRALVEVKVSEGLVAALVYHQVLPDDSDRADIKCFASGDWFDDGPPPEQPGCGQQ